MSRVFEDDYGNPNAMGRQRDLVLAMNEFCFLQSKTNGAIKTYAGPTTMTISQQEALVVFNEKTKQFEETQDFNKAKRLFVSAPEGWYVVLKNPAEDNRHPESGTAASSPKMTIGKKINIAGPVSFPLFPGQMAKTVRGHRLRSNQYLLARVYDAAAAKEGMETATIVDADGKEVEAKSEEFFVGQLLVIKGTEVSFYMPPTGIEVIPILGTTEYVREAVTLERLEYAILKDENGEKRYVHGPSVVFPKPTETFVEAPKGGNIFRALELSPISGIYVKVIADYEENGVKHPTGEELFITGNDTMIYYPKPEHAIIQYDGKYMHHAIAIPEGEGRYVLNRLTGEIKTIVGPKMYLPDPRTEVVVKRKLSRKECELLYPNNTDVLEYNEFLTEKAVEKLAKKGGFNNAVNTAYSTSNQQDTLAIFEATANISRGVSYTKPRTITLDTKFDGVVSVDVWTGYAINVVDKKGNREVVVGPKTRLLDYDETVEAMSLSTRKPKTSDKLLQTAFLRVENNKISDIIEAQTADFVNVRIKVSYCVDFLEKYKDKWFSVENYVKYLCDKERSLLKEAIKKYSIEEFYAKSTEIIRQVALNLPASNEGASKTDSKNPRPLGRFFKENGMLVSDVEVLTIDLQMDVARIIKEHQEEMVSKTLELTDAARRMEVVNKLAEYEKQEAELNHANKIYKLELAQKAELESLKNEAELNTKRRAEIEAKTQAESDLQEMLNAIAEYKLERAKKEDEARLDTERSLAEIEKGKQEAYAQTVADIMESISPDLVAAMTSRANADMLEATTQAMSPYAMAKGESVADVTDKLLRGTTLESVIENISKASK